MAVVMGSNKSVRMLSDHEAARLFDTQAQRYLNMSGAEFIRKWEAGEFENPDSPDVMRLAMLMPLAKLDPADRL